MRYLKHVFAFLVLALGFSLSLAAQTRGDTVAADAAFERFYGIIRRREAVFPSDYDVYRAVEVTQKYTRSQAQTAESDDSL